MSITFEDRLAIRELVDLYAHVVDRGDWHRMGELFVPDAVFDASSIGAEVDHGVEAIVQHFSTGAHPLHHYMTNVVVFEEAGETRVWCKGLYPRTNGFSGAVYDDVVVDTPGGWRFQSRTLSRVWLMEGDIVGRVWSDPQRA